MEGIKWYVKCSNIKSHGCINLSYVISVNCFQYLSCNLHLHFCSPGCGAYCDNSVGAVSTTGHGESIMKVTLARDIIYNMQQGKLKCDMWIIHLNSTQPLYLNYICCKGIVNFSYLGQLGFIYTDTFCGIFRFKSAIGGFAQRGMHLYTLHEFAMLLGFLLVQCSSGVTGGGGAGGQSVPQRLLTGKFLLTFREKEVRKKGKRGEN